MQPWTDLIYPYLGAAVLATALAHRLLRGQWWRYTRALALTTLILLLGEAIAEERGLWTVTQPSGHYVLAVPIEAVLLVLATLVNSLLPYVWLEKRRRTKGRAGPAQPPPSPAGR